MTVWQAWNLNRTKVVFCDVGQGDGILLQRGMSQLVVDVGPENRRMVNCLGKHMPFWDKKVEGVLITHWDKDHSGGLSQVASSYRIEGLYSGRRPEENIEQISYTNDLRQGDVVRLGEMGIEIVSPAKISGEDNADSVVGVFGYMGYKILLMGDASLETEQRLVWRKILDEEVDVLKVSHHGSKDGTGEELLERVRPKMAVISVGKNSFGHPTAEVLERLKKYGIELRRTDKEGDVVLLIERSL